MYMIGALVRRWTAEELKKRKKRGSGRIDTYRINRAAAAEANYDGYISPLETVLTIMAAFEAAVSPRLHRARLAVSAAINAPAIVGGFPREIGPSVTLALSQGYVSSQHLDSSGKWAWESIAWPPCRRAPSDWTFAIPGAGLLVERGRNRAPPVGCAGGRGSRGGCLAAADRRRRGARRAHARRRRAAATAALACDAGDRAAPARAAA